MALSVAQHKAKLLRGKKYRDANRERIRRFRNRNIAGTLLRGARGKAKARGVGFNLTIRDIIVPTHCPVFGIKLRIGRGCSSFCSPTLDRVNPKRGYIQGNVAVISQFANALKGKATPDQLRKIADWVDKFKATCSLR